MDAALRQTVKDTGVAHKVLGKREPTKERAVGILNGIKMAIEAKPDWRSGVMLHSMLCHAVMSELAPALEINAKDERPQYLRVSPDGSEIATVTSQGRVARFSTSTGNQIGEPIPCCHKGNRAQWQALPEWLRKMPTLSHLKGKLLLRGTDGHLKSLRLKNALRDKAVTPDGSMAIFTFLDGNAEVYRLYDTPARVCLLPCHMSPITNCAIASSGIAVATMNTVRRMRVYNTTTGQCLLATPPVPDEARQFCLSPLGEALFATWKDDDGGEHCVIWTTGEGEAIYIDNELANGDIEAVAFSNDAKVIALGTYNGIIIFVETRTGDIIASIRTEDTPIRNLQFSHSGFALFYVIGPGIIRALDMPQMTNCGTAPV